MYKSNIKYVLTILILFYNALQVVGQTENATQELLIQFQSGVIQSYKGESSISLSEKSPFISSDLQSTLRKFGGKYLVKAFPEFKQSDTLKTSRTGEIINLPDYSRTFLLRLSNLSNINTSIDSLKNIPSVIFVEPNGVAITQIVPNDPRYDNPSNPGSGGEQWNLLNTGQNSGTYDADIDAPKAWDITKGSTNTKIAIIDNGVRSSHEDLSGKVSGDVTYADHGTHVAGIAAANTNNGKGIAGIDWNAQIINKVKGSDAQTSNSIINAVNSGADVLNSSFILCSNCLNQVPSPRYSTPLLPLP